MWRSVLNGRQHVCVLTLFPVILVEKQTFCLNYDVFQLQHGRWFWRDISGSYGIWRTWENWNMKETSFLCFRCGVCPSCGNRFPICVATGRPLMDTSLTWTCMVCKHSASEQDMTVRQSCPLCHTPVQMWTASDANEGFLFYLTELKVIYCLINF